jgi:cytosine/adenosine deaminase-related metal-dependent hydrolase
MILNDVKLMGLDGVFNIGIDSAHISFISNSPFAEFDDRLQLSLNKALAIPGLINSHDHLDFNLFPQLGTNIYTNYVEWGEHIHQNYKEQIDRVLAIPVSLRAKWGIYKNLLCGVTTVVDHGIKHNIDEELITVHHNCQSLHSVRLERNWKSRLNNPLKLHTPVAIHICEGTDTAATFEIDELIRWNILQRELIGIHGVAMTARQAKHFKALVWCPETNYFLLNKTAPVNQLKDNTTILFGTDSTLTGNWDIWDHIRLAQKARLLNNDELYQSLTTNPASIWKTNSGQIAEGKNADIVIIKPGVSFFDTKPEDILLVIHHGNIRLFDESLSCQLTTKNQTNYSKIELNGTFKYVQGDLLGLIDQIKLYYSKAQFPINTTSRESVSIL